MRRSGLVGYWENALDALHWLEDYGMEFTDKVVAIQGAMWERSGRVRRLWLYPNPGKGSQDLGVEILLKPKQKTPHR